MHRIAPRHLVSLALLAAMGLAAQPLHGQAPVALSGVELAQDDATEVVVHLAQPLDATAVSTFTARDPHRVVMDIAGAKLADVAGTVPGDGIFVDRIELSTLEDPSGNVVRVTVYTVGPMEGLARVEGDRVVLKLEAPDEPAGAPGPVGQAPQAEGASSAPVLDISRGVAEGPGTPSGPHALEGRSLASLDYVDGDTVASVVLSTNVSVDYATSQPEPDLVVVDLPGVKVPKSLERVLDASQFISPVRSIRAYPTRSGARVAIRLRRSVEWKVEEQPGNLVVLRFEVPADMQAERQAALQAPAFAAPLSPEQTPQGERLESAYASETLIGHTGHTMDPQAAFGTGRGAAAAGALGGMPGYSFDESSALQGQFTGRRINLDLVEADIHAVFRLISHVSRLNIVAGDDVSGKVTVRLIDVPWDQALMVILQAKGLASQRFGNIIRVAPIETIKAEQQAALDAKVAKEQLEPLQVLVVPLNYATAQDVADRIKSQVTARGSVEADTRSNQVIIKETEARLAQIRELIRQIDRQTPQVLIEARIVEATSKFSRALGIQWGGELNASGATGASTGLLFPSSVGISGGNSQDPQATVKDVYYSPGADNLLVDLGADSAFGSLALALGSVTGLVNLDARLSAMETEGWGEIVSAPRVTTLDNTPATIRQGAKVPYLSTSSGGTQVQFVTAALVLEVTPHITSDNRIFMNISVENNRPDFSSTVQGQPAIQIKEAQTQLLVDDGDTTVIGGVFATEDSGAINRIPLLGEIPVLGRLFRNQSRSTSRNEMLVFVTPRIVTTARKQTD